MSIDITVYASDIRNLGEEIENHLNIENEYGHSIFDEDDRLSLIDYDYSLEPHTYISIMVEKWIKNREEVEKWDGSMLK